MLKIRLQRVGRKHDPSFRIVLTDSRKAPQSGAFLEILGFYDSRKKQGAVLNLKKERIEHWISRGAQTTGTVHNLLVSEKVIKGSKINVSPAVKEKKKPAQSSEGIEAGPPSSEGAGGEEAKQEDAKEKVEKEKKKKDIKEAPTLTKGEAGIPTPEGVGKKKEEVKKEDTKDEEAKKEPKIEKKPEEKKEDIKKEK